MKAGHGLRLIACAIAAFATHSAGAATGKEIFGTTCVACHGAGAQGNPSLGAPALAGQSAAYLERQLNDFRSGLRGANPQDSHGAQMRAASATLSDGKAIAAVAAYLAALPAPVVKPAANANLRNGNNFYQGKCGACHGGRAEGIASMSTPRLSGLDAAYITRQFHGFQQGLRGSSPQDRYGRQMAMMAGTLPKESDLADVIAFIHAQGAAK
jgi:cbb3-type cytochrome c oxidase subunit III